MIKRINWAIEVIQYIHNFNLIVILTRKQNKPLVAFDLCLYKQKAFHKKIYLRKPIYTERAVW